MKRRYRDKALSLILSFNLIVNSVVPFFTFAPVVVSAEPLKAEVSFKTEENIFDISVTTQDDVEYLLSWKNQDDVQGTSITKAEGNGQDFQRDIYAGVKSGPDARRDTVLRGIYKAEVKSQHWITAIKFALDDGHLREEGKTEYRPDSLDLTQDEVKWLEEGDVVTPTPTPTNEPASTPTPTVFEEQGDLLDEAASDTVFQSLADDGEVETVIVESFACRADSLNGCLVTDKPDYAPTDTAIITGHGFAPNTTYSLRITSSDEPAVDATYEVTTDDHGSFTASYQLDGYYRPNYTVRLYDENNLEVASVAFLDHASQSVSINGGASTTSSLDVTLNISWEGLFGGLVIDPDYARFANDLTPNNGCHNLGAGAWSSWESISDEGGNTATKAWTLASGGNGNRKVCVEMNHTFLPHILIPMRSDDTINYSVIVPICGDGILNGSEECDGSDLGGLPGTDFTCTNQCNLDLVEDKVEICHATASHQNPYVSNEPNKSGDVSGHDGHDGPIWYPGIDVVWGDIIPPFYYVGGYYPGQNWTTEGQAIHANDCNFTSGTLTVHKQVDTDGDGDYDVSTDAGANDMGFAWNLDDSDTYNSFGTTNAVTADDYTVYEKPVEGYHLSGWFLGAGSCSEEDLNETTPEVTVTLTQSSVITLCNVRDTGTITVDKVTDPSESEQLFTIRLSQGDSTVYDYVLGDTTTPETKQFLSGDYTLEELDVAGWDLDYVSCYVNDGDPEEYSEGDTISLEEGDNVYCTFENTQRGRVIVTKYNDLNGNGSKDDGEDVLSDWDMILAQGEDELNETTDENGEAEFEDVKPGSYILSEGEQENWRLTNISCTSDRQDERISEQELDSDNEHEVEVYAGETTTCEVGNQPTNPELQISKSNDGAEKSPGDTVTYTIKLKVLNSLAFGVVLKDLLPKGFTFQNVLSIIKNGSEDITGLVGNPNYASPGTYNLGDMTVDDEVVITYTAKIDSAQEFGLYKDIAWAKGTDVLSNKVLAVAQPEGYVDSNFVGTAVRVNGNLTENGNVAITEEGQVLGASTSMLPATGAGGIWITIASILSTLGLLIVALVLMIRKKKIKYFAKSFVIMLAFALTMFAGRSVYASELSVRLSEPKTPTKNADFKLVFTVLDLTESGSPITAKCFYKKNLGDGWTQFDTDKAVTAGGNTESCQVNSGIINVSGQTYYFKATATNGSASDDTELQGLVSVTFDNRDPGTPTNYSKNKISSCQYKISFKTADDGMTTRVEIYRSESTTMALDGSTRVGDVTVGPNTESSYTESVPDCNKTYYYVIRAFNVAGNGSGPIGDSVTITSSTTGTTLGEVSGAIPVTNVTLPGGAGGSGQVLGEEKDASASPTQKPEEVDVMGASDTASKVGSFVSKNKYYILGILAVIIAVSVYVFIKKKKEIDA